MTKSALTALLISLATAAGTFASPGYAFKDQGPEGRCDSFNKASIAWTACVGAAKADMPDDELFYAGYWLARTGHYEQALGYLTLARIKTERVLTYIGFATRKLGDVEGALPLYNEALRLNPDYAVARAYLGEAHLTKGDVAEARNQLREIERRCGTACAEYADLAGHIKAFEAARKNG
jgi:tetratricopeptide (TPR) repeat protein